MRLGLEDEQHRILIVALDPFVGYLMVPADETPRHHSYF